MSKNNVQSVCYLLCMQVIKPQIIQKPQNQSHIKTKTQTHIKNNTTTNIKHKIFKELVPSVLPLLKKHKRLGHAGIVNHSADLSTPDFKRQDRKSNRTRQKNKKGNSKVESNDSPGISDRGGDIRHPRPPFRGISKEHQNVFVST